MTVSTTGVTTGVSAAAVFDDPNNTSGLGAPAILRGTVYAHLCSGVTSTPGQPQIIQRATLGALQSALNYAANNSKFFEILPGTYEIYGSNGLMIPAGASNFVWMGHSQSIIKQFSLNAPILTVGDTGNSGYAAHQRINGFTLDYGVSQTGKANANALTIGASFGNIIENFNICIYYGNNPPSTAVKIATASTTNNFFFQNVIRDGTIGGAQTSLLAMNIGGTGNLFSNLYTHNGSSNSTRQSCSGPAWDLSIANYGQASDNLFERCNIEHVNTNSVLALSTLFTATFTGLHIEDVALTGTDPTVVKQTGGHVKFINTYLLDMVLSSASGSPSIYSPSGYGEHASFDGLMFKWSSYTGGGLSATTTIIRSPSNNGNDSNPAVSIDRLLVLDDAGNNAQNLRLDSILVQPLLANTFIGQYQGDNLLPSVAKLELIVTGNYTHYGAYEDAVLFVPATLTAPATLTLSNKRKPSGVGVSTPPRIGTITQVRRQSGAYANALTIADAQTGATLATNTAAGSDYLFEATAAGWVLRS